MEIPTQIITSLCLSCLLCLINSTKSLSLQCSMNLIEQFQDCFEVQLPIPKVQHIFFLNPQTLLLIHTSQQYSIIEIISRNQTRVLKHGIFEHSILEDVQPLGSKSVLYVHDNQLILYDLYESKTTHIYSIPKSEIYEEQFQFQLSLDPHDRKIVFYKTSVLKSTPVTVYYDVHLLSISNIFQKIRKLKVEYQDLRKFGFSCGEIVSYQTCGYSIEVNFIESNTFHQINSIFHLFLADAKLGKDEILLDFTHQELQCEVTSYSVSKDRVKKLERRVRFFEPHVYQNQSGSRSIVYKNCFNHRRRDHYSGIFRVKACKQSKYLKMLDELLPKSRGKQFKQQVLDLLT